MTVSSNSHFYLNFFDQECCNTQSFKSVGEILSVSIQMKATEQCFPVQGASNSWVLMSVKSFKCDHSNESFTSRTFLRYCI